ncbi:MAG TPA: hypothetical protein VKU02_02430 [Gemmataceae bacterium]|nr:hypothetical protein [Gemmataceae bacterium]
MTRSANGWPVRISTLVMLMPVVLVGLALTSRGPWSAARAQTAGAANEPFPLPPELQGVDLLRQTEAEAAGKSAGCIACHASTHDPHNKATVHLGCVDCHGGDPNSTVKEQAHVLPRFPGAWKTSANPVRSYALLNHECPEFIRFVNPGDLRIAHISCGTVNCHPREVLQNRKSMMTHGCMLWGAALYNNGAIPNKWSRFGESYSMHGVPLRVQTVPPPTEEELRTKGVLPFLDPLPRFEITQPGNLLRIFERGGRFRLETGIPERDEDPGKPRTRLSDRGLGTENRTDPTMLGLQKTRLLDPTLNFLGTNDHPGDYRSSGCTACHVIYANDRSPVHSGPYADKGNRGLSYNPDPTIPKEEPGHPIEHAFTTAIPTSQCIVCHIHPGTNVLNTYLGYLWWDEETDGELMYPAKQKYPTSEEFTQAQMFNPDEAAARGLWSNPRFLESVSELNPKARHTQFADFHGHGWIFRAVYKKDRKGNLLDDSGKVIDSVTTDKLMTAMRVPVEVKELLKEQASKGNLDPELKKPDNIPVHLLDIHLEKGMHCIDCHFIQDSHGNTKLQGEVRAAIEIQCIDCHGTVNQRATLRTTGPAAYTSSPEGSRNLESLRTPFGKRRFERRGNTIVQNSMVEKGLAWEITQVVDTITPGSKHYNEKAALAKTVRLDAAGQMVWGPVTGEKCAHANENMSCIACHSSWNPSCYGCHLPQKANKKVPMLHNEGDVSRNYISYNFQTLRDDVFMLARDGDVTKNRIGPVRSSCAIHVSSYNGNREEIYTQQQTISSEGMSGIAFSTNVPHTVRGRGATKLCTDCHLSKDEDNNAIMAQLLMQGTNYVNFVGRFCWVAAGEHGLAAVEVTERDEPQAVIGSSLHHLAFPDYFCKHVENGRMLKHAHEHPGKDIGDSLFHPLRKPEILMVQNRGEYLYAACGEQGLRVFDIAFIADKAFSERITTAPVSPLGQRFYVRTKYATAVASPTTLAPDPTRSHDPLNHEPNIAGIYGNIYVTDKYEGLVIVGIATTINGNPLDNFLKRELTFNPDGILCGARNITIVGTYAYICCDAGLVVVALEDPKHPEIKSVLGGDCLKHPHAVQVQFRYGYVCDEEGIKVLDVTDLARPVLISKLDLAEAHNIYLARTYAYVAAGSQGLVILDIEKPALPRIDQVYNAGGCINDVHDVKLGITYVSEFAYLADGKNGLRVVQLTSPETPGNDGFSPRPTPELIATYKIPHGGHAVAVAKGLDRDRAVDESGNQIAVFGRVGARPLNLEEQHKLYLRDGHPWKVSDDPRDEMYKHVETATGRQR